MPPTFPALPSPASIGLLLAITTSCATALGGESPGLDELLARGELALVETHDDGSLNKVTVLSRIQAPRAVVWNKLADFENYVAWMPQVVKSQVVSRRESPEGTEVLVDWSIKVPGPNVQFRTRYILDEAAGSIVGTWVSGALEGSQWEWRLLDEGTSTMVFRISFSTAVADNWVLRQFDDDFHTLDVGINSATPIIEIKGLKHALGLP